MRGAPRRDQDESRRNEPAMWSHSSVLPMTMMASGVVPMRAYHDHTRLPDDDQRRRVVEAMVTVVVRTVVRATDYNLTKEVGIPETQRDSHAGLGLSDTGRESE